MKANTIKAAMFSCGTLMLGASMTGCMADAGDVELGENIGRVQEPLLTINQQGWAYVVASGTVSWSDVMFGSASASKIATGHYVVSFAGGTVGIPHAQVVAYGTNNAHCKLAEASSGHSWKVLCFSAAGAWTDSAFAIVMDDRSGTSTFVRGAYLRSSSDGFVTRSWNSGGGTNTVSWSGVNEEYTVTMPGMPTHNASVHVTADGSGSIRCKVRNWSTGSVKVKCHDAAGDAVQSQFYIGYHEFNQHGRRVGGHSWVTGGTPSATYSAALASNGCAAPGSFVASAGGLDRIVTLSDANYPTSWMDFVPMVTAYGNNSNYCKLTGWWASAGFNATVRCFDASGAQIDTAGTAFTLTFTANDSPGPC
jgi:hypothetical protein